MQLMERREELCVAERALHNMCDTPRSVCHPARYPARSLSYPARSVCQCGAGNLHGRLGGLPHESPCRGANVSDALRCCLRVRHANRLDEVSVCHALPAATLLPALPPGLLSAVATLLALAPHVARDQRRQRSSAHRASAPDPRVAPGHTVAPLVAPWRLIE